jgi:hypothetical protein
MRHHRLRHEKEREDISAKRSLQLSLGNFRYAFLRMLFGGVVYEDIDLPKFLHRPFYRRLTNFFSPDIAGNQQTFATHIFHQLFGFLRVFVFFQINDRDISAFFREKNRHRTANAAVAPRDNRDSIPKFAASLVIARARFRRGSHLVFAAGSLSLMLRRSGFFLLRHARNNRF